MKRLSGMYLLAVFLPFSLTQTANATTVIMLSDRELALDSQIMLTGEVRSVISRWDDAREMIWTYVEIERDILIKGNIAETTIVLKQPGGEVWPAGVEVFGQPKFATDQKVLLYLRSSRDGSLHVAHSFMGMFSIVKDASSGALTVVREFDNSRVEVRPRSDTQTITDRAPLEYYISNLKLTLQRESSEVDRIESERLSLPVYAVPAEYEKVRQITDGFTPHFAFMSGGVRWMQADSDEAIKFYVNAINSPVDGGGLAEMTRAMDAWSYRSGAAVWIVPFGQTSRCGLAVDNQNTISFGDCQKQLDSPANCAGVLARTQLAYSSSETKLVNGQLFKRLTDTDIVFNDGMDCFLKDPVNLAEVFCHELGHSIGLGHSSVSGAIMQPNAHFDGRDATLSDDDKTGVRAIYPRHGNSARPEIVGVKLKGTKKLTISGQHFTATSLIMINGKIIKPKKFTEGGEVDSLLYKGKLNAVGANEVCVMSSGGRSELFYF